MSPAQAKLRKSLIKQIHISKRYQERYKDHKDEYEHILDDRYGVTSSKELTIDQLKAFAAWLNYKSNELKQDKRLSQATEPQIRKIRALWNEVARDSSDGSLREMIAKITKKRYLHIEAIGKREAQKMIIVLTKMKKES